jgi:hypothetical protein
MSALLKTYGKSRWLLIVLMGPLLTSSAEGQTLLISPSALTFSVEAGAKGAFPRSIDVNSSGAPVSFVVSPSASWLVVIGTTPIGANTWQATTPTSVSVFVDPSSLAPGTYTGAVNIIPNGSPAGAKTVGVTLSVGLAAALVLAPRSFSFVAAVGSVAPPSQSLSVASSGSIFPFTAAVMGGNWLSINTGGGISPGTIVLQVNPTGLSAGNYNSSVLVSATSASNSPQTLPVALTVAAVGTTPPPPVIPLASVGYIPHIADGAGWSTIMSVVNASTAIQVITVRFYSESGGQLALPILGLPAPLASLNFTLPPNGSDIIATTGLNSAVTVGWATVTGTGLFGTSTVFRWRRPGHSDSEAASPLMFNPPSALLFPFDSRDGLITGLALANTSANMGVNVLVKMMDKNANLVSQHALFLQPQSHVSFTLTDIFPIVGGLAGVLEIISSAPGTIVALGLRFDPDGSFTSIQAIERR